MTLIPKLTAIIALDRGALIKLSVMFNCIIYMNNTLCNNMETLSCHDAGLNCITIIQEKTKDEIMGKAIEYAMKEHT